MRTVKWNAFLSGLCCMGVILGTVVASAHADVTSEVGSSVLIFPKVRADSTYDTIIQITNTGNSMLHAHCYYVNASLSSTLTGLPCDIPSSTCVPQWQETDFTIWLTKQQPTHWLASTGRRVDPFDKFASDGYGFDPGRVPPVTQPFVGELKCIEISESGEPVTGNHLKGEATLKVISTVLPAPGFISSGQTTKGDVSKYNAVGIRGNPEVQPTNPLLLDDNMYDACPAKLILNHLATGVSDPVAEALVEANPAYKSTGTFSLTATDLTLVPCSEDFENQRPKTVTVQFVVYNEFEERFSASTTVTCFLEVEITNLDAGLAGPFGPRSVFSISVLGTPVAQTEITPVVNLDGSSGGLVGIAERFSGVHTGVTGNVTAASHAAYNLHTEGSLIPDTGPDEIRLIDNSVQ